MLRPTVGELLEGVRAELAGTVLPALPPGAESRQLKAALHVLGVLATTWDRQRAALVADNADLDDTIEAFCARTGLVHDPGDSGDWSEEGFPGVHDEELRRIMARNESLQRDLEVVQRRWRDDPRADPGADQLLLQLHIRTTARAGGPDGGH